MFLSATDIRKWLATGALVIDPPPDDSQISSFSIDLRLGTQFVRLAGANQSDILVPAATSSGGDIRSRSEVIDLDFGQKYVVGPLTTVMCVSLEFVMFPLDLSGLLLPRNSLERVGITVEVGSIHPGFAGKLVLSLRNNGQVAAAVYPGQRIVELLFAPLSSAISPSGLRARLGS